jgi:hypothetical protein
LTGRRVALSANHFNQDGAIIGDHGSRDRLAKVCEIGDQFNSPLKPGCMKLPLDSGD